MAKSQSTLFSLLLLVALSLHINHAFQVPTKTSSHHQGAGGSTLATALSAATSASPNTFGYPLVTNTNTQTTSDAVELRTYQHEDGWTVRYRYKPAARGMENEPALLLIHPVGIGMSSWFWDEFLKAWNHGGAVYAPDLLGCGIDNGSDAWDPQQQNLEFPSSWVQGCETLLHKIISPSSSTGSSNKNNPLVPSSWFRGIQQQQRRRQVIVVTQGGLAPVGVQLASRNPQTITRLVMTSPPTWKDMTVALPRPKVQANYEFLTSPLGNLAFAALESSWAIRFFSNLFLFQNKANEEWMSQCLQECRHGEMARPPIQAFNAGWLQQQSYMSELTTLSQPTLIVQGASDVNRNPLRNDYGDQMKDCTIVTLPTGLNVLPWECPDLFVQTIQQYQSQQSQPQTSAPKVELS